MRATLPSPQWLSAPSATVRRRNSLRGTFTRSWNARAWARWTALSPSADSVRVGTRILPTRSPSAKARLISRNSAKDAAPVVHIM
ncbi:hypothetical protein [Microbispora siamensis]|uniref:hypothetical protein n=1 Tax=Microbispora siamensis TaxID=564413 RepID=UPI0019515BE2|nr:hypothetical protein [Microbispora siamensis]